MEQQKPEGKAQPGGDEPAPREEMIMTRMVKAIGMIIYNEEITDQLLAMMGGEDPAAGVAQAAQLVLGQMAEKVKGVPPEAVYELATTAIALLTELGAAAGLFEKDPAIIAKAVQMVNQGRQRRATPPQGPAAPPQQGGGLIDSPMGAMA